MPRTDCPQRPATPARTLSPAGTVASTAAPGLPLSIAGVAGTGTAPARTRHPRTLP